MDKQIRPSGPDLRFLRRAREVSQSAMARQLGVSRARIQGIEWSPRPSAAGVARWLAALDVLAPGNYGDDFDGIRRRVAELEARLHVQDE